MSFKGKTYSKKGSSAKSGNPFDRMMKEQCNKPVAAKSAGIVGKWGATSFTSLRGSGDNPNPGVPKVKKFFKSRTDNSEANIENVSEKSSESPIVTVASAKIINVPEKPKQPASKKFFRARNREIDPSSKEGIEDTVALPQARARPSRPAQRSNDMSRSPIQRSPTHRSSVERSPIHISPPSSLPSTSPKQMPAPSSNVKPLPVPQVRRSRQPKVPEFKENPRDKANRLAALIDSQSKENKPSVKSEKATSKPNPESLKSSSGHAKVSLPPKFPNFLPKILEKDVSKSTSDESVGLVERRKRNNDLVSETTELSANPGKELRQAQKRKVEDADSLPPIKLKLSLNKSPYVADQYSVVNRPDYDDSMSESSVGSEQPSTVHDSDTASDKTDMSNGFSSSRSLNPSSGYNVNDGESILSKTANNKIKQRAQVKKATEPSIVEQSDLELLDGDFVVDYSETESIDNMLESIPHSRTRSSSPATLTRSPSPAIEVPPRKIMRKASPVDEAGSSNLKRGSRKPTDKEMLSAAEHNMDSKVIMKESLSQSMKPLPVVQRKPKKPGPIKEVFETVDSTVTSKKTRKTVSDSENIPKRVSRRQSPIVHDNLQFTSDIEPKETKENEIFNSGDDTEPETGGCSSENGMFKGRKKSPDPMNVPCNSSKNQRKQKQNAKKEPKKSSKKQGREVTPLMADNQEIFSSNTEENSNDSDFSLGSSNSLGRNTRGNVNRNSVYSKTQTCQRYKEPSPETEITFSPRGKTSPALSNHLSGKADSTDNDDPPTRPQSPVLAVPKQSGSDHDISADTSLKIKHDERESRGISTYSRRNNKFTTDNFQTDGAQSRLSSISEISDLQERSVSPDFESNFPARITSVPSKDSRKPTTYKKSFFKSRGRGIPNETESVAPVATSSPRDLADNEPPRVPPISFPNVIPSAPDSSSLSDLDSMELNFPLQRNETKPKKQFFKSRNKSPVESLSSQEALQTKLLPVKSKSTSQIGMSAMTSDYESSQLTPPLRSPSPDFNIEYPVRISAPAKEVVPSVKPLKRSIFKSKAKSNQENCAPPKKALSLYKHKMGWGGDKDELKKLEKIKEDQRTAVSEASTFDSYDDSEFDSEPVTSESDISFAPSKLTRVATYPSSSTGVDVDGDLVTQVKCPKSYKEYFTVIKNVKKAHEMNDLGEYQEFNDDVEYISDGMKPKNSTAARCLAAVSLAVKCMKPNFRMHLRAHGEVSKFFVELKDAPSNPSLALCTSTILFVLSQDRLNMDMDRDSLELMLNLLDTDCSLKDALDSSGLDKKELAKNKQKVIDICTEMQSKGHAGTLNLDMISADHLAMETLLSMTSKRAGEWFKEELRELGGLGHLARTLTDCVSYLTVRDIKSWTEGLTEKLKKANRILRVLENVSHENEENCGYLIEYGRTQEVQEEEFLEVLQKLFKLLDEEVQLNPTTDYADKETIGVILRDTLFSVIRVHINLVHDYRMKAYGSLYIGQKQGCMARVLRTLFIMPYWFCPLSKRFEALVLALTLLINMVEHCDENRQSLMDSMAAQKDADFCVKEEPRMAVEDLVQLFIDRDTLAKMSEEKTDNILDDVDEEVQEIDPREDPSKKNDKPTLDETVQKLIGKAGNHMESTLIAAYVGLVMGYLIKNSDDYEQRIREYLPSRDFKGVVVVLTKLHNFMKMTSIGTVASSKGIKATEKIIKHMEKIDAEPESEEEKEDTVDFSLFDVSRDDTTLIDNTDNYASTSYNMDDWGRF